MKKFFVVIFSFLICSSAFSMGMGPMVNGTQKITFNEEYSASSGAACSLKIDTLPFYFGFSTDYDPFINSFDVNLSGDYWFGNPEILPNWNIYFGIGGAIGVNASSESAIMNFGPRVVLGTNWFLLDGFLELFVQQVFQQNVSFEFGGSSRTFYPAQLPFSIGVRIWD